MGQKEQEELKELRKKRQAPPQVMERYECGNSAVEFLDNGSFLFYSKGAKINGVHSRAQTVDGKEINTRTARRESWQCEEVQDCFGKGKMAVSVFRQDDLKLTQKVTVYEQLDHLTVQVVLEEAGGITRTRFLAPVETLYPDWSMKPLFLSLDQKMLLVPYDNDMWVRYESTPPRPGRRSYDVTAVYDEETLEGLVIGAVDFDTWKNAIAWSSCDARCVSAFCGAADGCTHDVLPHGIVEGKEVASARFVLGWYEDIRRGMEEYGRLCTKVVPARKWPGKVPFGWNSYSGLGGMFQIEHWKEAGEFISRELPEFGDDDGVTYINMDAAFGVDQERVKEIIGEIHARGQKAGWYAGPCIAHRMLEQFMRLKGSNELMSAVYLKDFDGNPLPPVDGSTPLDVTHPLWEQHARQTVRELVALGIDYLKIDFLSHASLEGNFYDPSIKTGRQAIHKAYSILSEELSPEKVGRQIFVSLSIAPLFPYFLGHARRSCCDAFGHYDDVRYVLNALNFGWWSSGTIYAYADPDHCALYHSMIDGRSATTEEEARSRYNTAVISGTVVLLSDNYGPVGDETLIRSARERAKQFANNRKLNEVALLGKAFIPAELKDGTTPVYFLKENGRAFLAVFNFRSTEQEFALQPGRFGLPEAGTAYDLNRDQTMEYAGTLRCRLAGHDSVVFELKGNV